MVKQVTGRRLALVALAALVAIAAARLALGNALRWLLTAGQVEGGAGQRRAFVVGLLATVAVSVTMTRIARRALTAAVEAVPTALVAHGVRHA